MNDTNDPYDNIPDEIKAEFANDPIWQEALQHPTHFRMDGTPYEADNYLRVIMDWGRDFEDFRGRIVAQELLWNGLFVSTVWTGIDSLWPLRRFEGRPLIYETMVFDNLNPDASANMEKYATLDEAHAGHLAAVREARRVWPTIQRWLAYSLPSSVDEDVY